MGRIRRKTVYLFIVDVLFSTMASAVAILFLRFYYSAIPDFKTYLYIWCISSAAASTVAVSVSKTYKIVFKYANFSAIFNIIGCAVIKIALMCILFFFKDIRVMEQRMLLILIDYTFTMMLLVAQKSYQLLIDKEEEEEEEEEQRAVNCLNVLIYGTSPKSIAAISRYQQSKNFVIKGLLTRDKDMNGKLIHGIPAYYLAPNSKKLKIKDAEAILFPHQEDYQNEADNLVKICDQQGICILTLPSAESTNFPGLETKEIKHILENKFIPDNMTSIGRVTKRLLDFSISALLIVVFSIPMLCIAIAIRLTEGAPVLFRQERIGRFGRPFNILKFRTMKLDAEADGPALYSGDDDPRLTKIGKFLRVHHLDEMPQLFNVFIGDMSFVGYRPERKVYIDQIVEKDPRYAYLYQIRPGVTSYATLKNGYTDTLDKMLMRLKYDLYYLNHRSLIFDGKILCNTFLNIVFGKIF